MSVVQLLILAFTCLIAVQLTKAFDLPFFHPDCDEYEDASQPTQLPYPNDCTKFYKCSAGYAFTLSCPSGLHWSVKNYRCDYPGAANCIAPVRPTPSPIDNDMGIIILDCPYQDNPNDPTHLPYPGDCTKFFKCKVGKAYPLSCPFGLHWSVVLNQCEWPEVAKCARVPVTLTTILTTSTKVHNPATTLSPTTALTSTPTTMPTLASTIEPTVVPTQTPTPASSLTPNQSSNPASNTAPTPTLTLAPTLAPTLTPTPALTLAPTPAPNRTPVSATPSDLNIYCRTISIGNVSYPGNCRRYIQCVNGLSKIQNCPANLFFNSKYGVCSRICV